MSVSGFLAIGGQNRNGGEGVKRVGGPSADPGRLWAIRRRAHCPLAPVTPPSSLPIEARQAQNCTLQRVSLPSCGEGSRWRIVLSPDIPRGPPDPHRCSLTPIGAAAPSPQGGGGRAGDDPRRRKATAWLVAARRAGCHGFGEGGEGWFDGGVPIDAAVGDATGRRPASWPGTRSWRPATRLISIMTPMMRLSPVASWVRDVGERPGAGSPASCS